MTSPLLTFTLNSIGLQQTWQSSTYNWFETDGSTKVSTSSKQKGQVYVCSI